MFSAAGPYSPALYFWRWKLRGDSLVDHRRRVSTEKLFSVPYPMMGRSCGSARTSSHSIKLCTSSPLEFCVGTTFPPNLTSVEEASWRNSHGLPLSSQQSGRSTWTPHHSSCSKMPYWYLNPYPIAGYCRVASESMKHEASLPRPPFPMPASGSIFKIVWTSRFIDFKTA